MPHTITPASLSTVDARIDEKFGAISIFDLVLNIAYFPEMSRFFGRLSAQVPFQEVLHAAFVPCTYSLFMYLNSHERVNELY